MEKNDQTIPTFASLVKAMGGDNSELFVTDKWNELLNMPPHQSWVKKFPTEMGIKNGGEYLPIDKVELLLAYIYQKSKVEVLQVQALFQSIQVTVRLHVRNPLTKEWEWQDGVGAAPIQTDKDKSAADLGAIKTRAVQIAVPIAKAAAKKDAAEEYGRIFGRDLNRKDTVMFAGGYGNNNDTPPNVSADPGVVYKATPPPATNGAPKPNSFNFNTSAL